MGRLREQYGANVYSRERSQGIWKEVEFLSEREWDRAVGNLIASCLQPPLLHKIREAIEPYKARMYEAKERELRLLKERTPICKKCGNSGSFSAKQIGTIYTALFKCNCPIGNAIGTAWKFWGANYVDRYEPIFWSSIESDDFVSVEKAKELFSGDYGLFTMPGYVENPDRARIVAQQKYELDLK